MGRQDKSLKRKKPARREFKTLLIVCEGGKTEPNYFNEVYRKLGSRTVHVEIVSSKESGHTDPPGILAYARRRRAGRAAEHSPLDHVVCVFDRDQHVRVAETLNAAKPCFFDNTEKTDGAEIRSVFSGPSFELWFLLHFQDQTAHVERDQVLRKLKEHVPGYDKGISGMGARLESRREAAAGRAGCLRRRQEDACAPLPDANPWTNADQLVALMISLARP
jgi:hypothetical protein